MSYPLNDSGKIFGAAKENRTLNFCLEGSGFPIKLQPHKIGALGLNRTDSHGLQNRWFTTNRQGQNWWRWLESSQRSSPYEGAALDHYATSPLVRVLSYLFKDTFQSPLHPSDSPQVSHQRRRIHAKVGITMIVWLLVRHFALRLSLMAPREGIEPS
jgi:hypothetical protein